jgi:hypothetical protein
MIPSGLANFFGLLPIGQYPAEPILSLTVLIGMLLLAVTLIQTAAGIWTGHLYASMAGFMFIVAFMFFRGANDYGLFKLAMFCQPALAACFAFLALSMLGRWWRAAPILILAGTGSAQAYYTMASAGLVVAGVVEVPEMSHFGLVFAVPKVTAISDIDLMPAQGLAAIVFRGSQVFYPSVARGKFSERAEKWRGPTASAGSPRGLAHEAAQRTNKLRNGNQGKGALRILGSPVLAAASQSDFAAIRRTSEDVKSTPPGGSIMPAQEAARRQSTLSGGVSMRERISEILGTIRRAATFPVRKLALASRDEEEERSRLMNRISTLWGSEFFEFAPDFFENTGGVTHLLTLQREFLFNSSSPLKDAASYGVFRLVPYQNVRNWLVFIPSSLGPDYYYERFGASFYQPELDPYRPGSFMSSVGRFFLVQVVHPTDKLRVRVSLTRSILGSNRLALPTTATIQGESLARLPFLGDGSGNVYSEAITPLIKDGQPYLAIDFGLSPSAFPNKKAGLMRLYNREFSIDHRRLVGFSRDISAISDEEYQHLQRPRKIEGFPSDLLSNTGLEYSGIYEDGWISRTSFVKLGPSTKGESVIIEGMVPMLDKLGNGALTVKAQINDAPPEIRALKPGNFRLAAPIGVPEPVTKLRLEFSDSASLPGGDGRSVAALVRSISIQ